MSSLCNFLQNVVLECWLLCTVSWQEVCHVVTLIAANRAYKVWNTKNDLFFLFLISRGLLWFNPTVPRRRLMSGPGPGPDQRLVMSQNVLSESVWKMSGLVCQADWTSCPVWGYLSIPKCWSSRLAHPHGVGVKVLGSRLSWCSCNVCFLLSRFHVVSFSWVFTYFLWRFSHLRRV